MAESDREHIPLKIKQEIGNYAANHGTKAAIDRSSKVYAKINSKCMGKKVQKNDFLSLARRKERPSLVDYELLQKYRDVMIGNSTISKNGNCDWSRRYQGQ